LDRGVKYTRFGNEAELYLEDIVGNVSKRFVPVLHLHGCVGWYRRDDGSTFSTNATRHDNASGIPIVMLPDPEKSFADDILINQIWTELEVGLRRAKSIFILGHSLHDESLLRALNANVEPKGRIAVGVLGADQSATELGPGAPEVEFRAREVFGDDVTIVPIRIGETPQITTLQSVREWRQQCELL
jgi:hypothetical protein